MYLLNEFFLNLEIFSSSKLFVWLNVFFFFFLHSTWASLYSID
jgi:hypothetical protein